MTIAARAARVVFCKFLRMPTAKLLDNPAGMQYIHFVNKTI